MPKYAKLDHSYNGRGDPAVLTFKCTIDDHLYLDPLPGQTTIIALVSEIVSRMPDNLIENADYAVEGYHCTTSMQYMTKQYRIYVRFSDDNLLSYAMLKINNTDFGFFSYEQIIELIEKNRKYIYHNS